MQKNEIATLIVVLCIAGAAAWVVHELFTIWLHTASLIAR